MNCKRGGEARRVVGRQQCAVGKDNLEDHFALLRDRGETVEAMKVLWTQPEAAYEGDLVRFPAVRCEPKPAQPGGPPVLLGAHGPKALERVARSYDGWFPLVQSPDSFAKQMTSLRQLTTEAGRDPDGLHITVIVDPGQGGPSEDELKRYWDAGAQGVVTFSQQMGTEIADGGAMAWIDRVLPTVERAQRVSARERGH